MDGTEPLIPAVANPTQLIVVVRGTSASVDSGNTLMVKPFVAPAGLDAAILNWPFEGDRDAALRLAAWTAAGSTRWICLVEPDLALRAEFLRLAVEHLGGNPGASGIAGRVVDTAQEARRQQAASINSTEAMGRQVIVWRAAEVIEPLTELLSMPAETTTGQVAGVLGAQLRGRLEGSSSIAAFATTRHDALAPSSGPQGTRPSAGQTSAPSSAVADTPATETSVRPVHDPYRAKDVRRGLMHFATGRLYGGVVSVLIVAMYARYMTVGDYAAYVTLSAMGTIVGGLTLLGLERAAMRFFPAARLSGDVGALTSLIRRLTLIRLVLLVAAIVAILAGSRSILQFLQLGGREGPLMIALVYLVAVSTITFQRYTLQSLMLQKELTRALVIGQTTRLVLLALIVAQMPQLDLVWGLSVMAATAWLQAGLQFIAYRSHLQILNQTIRGHWTADYRAIARYSAQNAHSTLMRQLTQPAALTLVAAAHLPETAVAAFGLFQALAERVRQYMPVFLTRTIIEPVATARYLMAKDFNALNDVLSVAQKLNLLALVPLWAWLVVSGPSAVAILTGGKYSDETWLLLVLLFSLLPAGHWAVLEICANAVDASATLAVGATVSAILTLLLLVITQPQFGILGLAATTAIASFVANTFVVYRLRAKGLDYRIEWRGVLVLIGAGAVAGVGAAGGAMLLPLRQDWLRAVSSLVIVLCLYFPIVLILRPFGPAEREVLARILPPNARRWLSGKGAKP